MRVGIDWRPAVSGRGGIAAYVRALVNAYAPRFPDDALALYGHRLRPGAAHRHAPAAARVCAARLPSRVAEVLARFGVGADLLIGGCDVFHLTDYALLRPTRARLVATVHDVLFDELPRCYTPGMRRGLAAVTRRLVARADRLLVPSLRTKIALVERFGAAPDRTDVVPLGVRPLDPSPRAPGPAAGGRPYLLAVGTLEPRKNLARLLAAHRVALARGLDADLVVAGARGWLDDDVVAALTTAPRVRWEDRPDDRRLAALLRDATGLAYPSLGEGFGLPVVEALAAGIPVLTTAAVPCLEQTPGAALLVDPYDVEALADGLLRLAGDATLRARLVAAGAAVVADRPWTRTAEDTRTAYLRAVA